MSAALDKLAQAAADMIAHRLREALSARGKASLMVSGGSSPKAVYEKLSESDLDWASVTVGLVDERWVKAGQAGSNETFIRNALLQNNAKAATFIPMKTDDDTAEAGAQAVDMTLAQSALPIDICVMGMGTDGHTASWFPNSDGLDFALSADSGRLVSVVRADGCAGAGEFPLRLTLTLPAVLSAETILLYIPGAAKRAVFTAAQSKTESEAPVRTLLRDKTKLIVFSDGAETTA